ncbi:hypothetical protein TWF132_010116 [Orbilia oligospora]|nr:hypothetical protein TWF132_010116 [Orbilia oligospora]
MLADPLEYEYILSPKTICETYTVIRTAIPVVEKSNAKINKMEELLNGEGDGDSDWGGRGASRSAKLANLPSVPFLVQGRARKPTQ